MKFRIDFCTRILMFVVSVEGENGFHKVEFFDDYLKAKSCDLWNRATY